MKKWLITIYSLAIIMLGVLIVFSLGKEDKELLYTIPQIKSFTTNDQKIQFEIYSTKPDSAIKYSENNLYNLVLDKQEVILNNVEVTQLDGNGYYVYIIEVDNFNNNNTINSRKCNLEIINSKGVYRANIGSLSILDTKEYELLGVDDLYASYSYFNGSLFLVGINITFSNKYNVLNNMKIGNYAQSINDLVVFEKKYGNEMNIISSIPKYNPLIKTEGLDLDLKSTTLFIPISYVNDLLMIKSGYITFELDNKKYYLDTFAFIANELDMNMYSNYLKEISYASN